MSRISRKSYYSNISAQYEVLKTHMGGRESVFLPFKVGEDGKLKAQAPIRWLLCNCRKFLNMQWERYHFLDNPMNLYHSLVVYTQLPRFSWSFSQKSAEQQVWMTEFKNYIKSYDFLVETDSDDLKLSFGDAIAIKRFLDKYKVVYYKKFSGSKGCHIVIPSEEFDWLSWKTYDHESEQNVRDFRQLLIGLPVGSDGNISREVKMDKVLLAKVLNLRLKTLLSCDTIDTSISDIKRIVKSPYSWDCKSDLIALPLTDDQLLNFNRDMCLPENVLPIVHKRGLLWRNTDVPKPEREILSKKMLEDLGILK